MRSGATPELTSILQHSPNGIMLVDENARVEFVNPAFRKMFGTGEENVSGRKAAELLQSDCFERVIAVGGGRAIRGSIAERGVHYRAGLFPIEGESRYCGIFIDTSEEERARAELRELKREMLSRAEDVIHRQMRTAQEIAGLLGETTAETKVLLTKLAHLFQEEGKT